MTAHHKTRRLRGPDGKKKHGEESHTDSRADNPTEPNDPGFPEGVPPIVGTVDDELKDDMI